MKVLWTARRRYEPGYRCNVHFHPFFHYFYLLEGVGSVRIGRESRRLRPHELYVTPEYEEHWYEPVGDQPIHTIEVKFDVDDPELREELDGLRGCVPDPHGRIKTYLESMVREGVQKRRYYAEMIDLRLRELLYALLRDELHEGEDAHGPVRPESASAANRNLHEAVAYIETNYREPIDLAKLAGIACYNTSYFCKLFRSEVGTSPIHYLIDTRIEKAKELFRNSDMMVSEVAEEVGFDSIHYFSRCFAGRVGCPPIEYRRKFRENIYVAMVPDLCKLEGIIVQPDHGGVLAAP